MRRVAVTGVGLVTALGTDAHETWGGLLAGRSGVGKVSGFDASCLRTRLAAEIDGFDPARYADRRALKLMTRNDQLAVAGATLAMRDARLGRCDVEGERTGLFVGGNKETSNTHRLTDDALANQDEHGNVDLQWLGRTASSHFHPLFYVEALQAASLFHISNAYGITGPNCYFVGTADAGATAIGRAYRSVATGESDRAIAGGFDDATSCWSMAKMDGLGVLTGRNELGAEAFRPFDRHRSGSVLGEGSAFVVLEALEHSQARGIRAYAEVTGYGSAFDPHAMLTPSRDGFAVASSVRRALDEAHLAASEIGYIASHGCATVLGDASEAAGLRSVFAAAPRRVIGSSVKPATGHLVAGAGALNVVVAALAIHHGAVPPTLNLIDFDPDCAHDVIDWIPGEGRELAVGHALALARGLEGQSIALALSRGPARGT